MWRSAVTCCVSFLREKWNWEEMKSLHRAWKGSLFGVFPVRIFSHLDWIRRYTEYLSVFNPNAKKSRPEKLWLRKLFTQCKAQLLGTQNSVFFYLLLLWYTSDKFMLVKFRKNYCWIQLWAKDHSTWFTGSIIFFFWNCVCYYSVLSLIQLPLIGTSP